MVPRSSFTLAAALLAVAGCSHSMASAGSESPAPSKGGYDMSTKAPSPDPRVGLKAGKYDAAEAKWNLHVVSETRPSTKFVDVTNSDMAFSGQYVIQGSYAGYQVWDISDPKQPTLKTAYYCPASQSDVSVYKNLLFVSAEAPTARLDCGSEGVKDTVSKERIRGIRIFDITDITAPKYLTNVQTCRGSHTHTVLVDPNDKENIYVYISGSAGVRSPNELAGCSGAQPGEDPNSAHFRIEVIKVPLAHPEQAAIVSSPRIFNDLAAAPTHGITNVDAVALSDAKAKGAFVAHIRGQDFQLPDPMAAQLLGDIVKARGGSGAPTHADSTELHQNLDPIVRKRFGLPAVDPPRTGPDQCHDITVYPQIGRAGGACEGYGMLLDIRDPVHPRRLAAVSDSNFSYWHSATFNNDGTKVLFSDEWGGGGQPKCRATDPHQWGADALFTIQNDQMVFQSYYKMSAPQTKYENCVAHNGSLIPIPGRDVMVQAWYQGGISVFDWTDAAHPREIAFFDRGPVDSTRMAGGGSWSVYWYNGVMISSEISRGLDIFELQPSGFISQNELDAAKTVHFAELNVQDQPKFVWPTTFVLARAYTDQLERSGGLSSGRVAAVRSALAGAEKASGSARSTALTQLASQLDGNAGSSKDGGKVQMLSATVKALAASSN